MLNAPAKPKQQNNSDPNEAPPAEAAPAFVQPFVRASDENLQAANLDRTSAVLSANSQDFGITNIPSYGFLSHLYILVEGTGGAAGLNSAVAKEDGPFAILRDIALTEPNGAVIASFNDGWQMAIAAQKYGGYLPSESADPRATPAYTAIATSGNFQFLIRLPVALSMRDGVGALANQDSAGEFKLKLKVGATTDIYSTAPDTKPVVRVRAWMQSWDQPEPSSGGIANQTEPPGHGTTGFWTIQSGIAISAGENNIVINRKGNYIRQMVLVFRRAGTSRANGQSDFPAEMRFLRDSFPARYLNDTVWKHIMFEKTGYDGANEAKKGLDNGVRFHDYMHEFNGMLGFENRDLWQVTRTSTRLEFAGNFANAGTLDILINDVAIAENVFL